MNVVRRRPCAGRRVASVPIASGRPLGGRILRAANFSQRLVLLGGFCAGTGGAAASVRMRSANRSSSSSQPRSRAAWRKFSACLAAVSASSRASSAWSFASNFSAAAASTVMASSRAPGSPSRTACLRREDCLTAKLQSLWTESHKKYKQKIGAAPPITGNATPTLVLPRRS